MGNQRRVMIAADHAVVAHEIEEIWNLLEIGRNIRVVAPQMHIVELNMDDVLDIAAG
jgi:hypothetical protein